MIKKEYRWDIGENSHIPDNDRVRILNLRAGNYVNIADDVEIDCLDLVLGDNVYIGKGSRISCRSLEVGNDNFLQGDVWIEGCRDNLETRVEIGNENLICKGTRINCNLPVKIGSDVGIGQNVRIWTHGYFMDRLSGYPYNTGKVEIGNHVWLIEGSIVLPNVNMGNDIIIGTNSLVNKDIPSGCFAAGNPVRILKEDIYPIELSYEEKVGIIEQVVSEYKPIMDSKGFLKEVTTAGLKIHFGKYHQVTFNCETMSIEGNLDEHSEDFRDYLRRNSIKFFNGTPFRSIMPLDFQTLASRERETPHSLEVG